MSTPDTIEINNLLAALPPEGGIVELNEGRIYDIDPVLTGAGGVRMTGVGKTLRLNGATLRAIPNDYPAYAVVRMGVGALDPAEARIHKGLNLVGPGVIEGDRYTHTGTSGEQGMAVWVTNSERVHIEGVEMRHCWGDGLYMDKNDVTFQSISEPFTRPLGVVAENCWIHHNRRNNVSLVGAAYVDLVGNRIEDADGTGPYAGIDIEPDTVNIGVEVVRISRNILRRNQGPGLEIVNVIGGPVWDVVADGNIITANGLINGFDVKVVDMLGGGWLTLTGNDITNNYGDGIFIERKQGVLRPVLIAQNRIRGQVAAQIAYDGGTYCGHGMRFKNMVQADVTLAQNIVESNGLGDAPLWQ